MDALVHDLRQAFRALRRSPGFAAVAVLMLALGIGAATAMFSVVDVTLLRPLPFHEPHRLVHVWETTPQGEDFSASEPNYLDFRAGARTLSALAAFRMGERSLTGGGEPERLRSVAATHSLFPVLGVTPALGRGFAASEDQPGGDARVAVLGDRLWRRRFGADPRVVGRTITLDGAPHTVVGVLPASFRLLDADVWTPLAPGASQDRTDHWLRMVGRLAPGATHAGAQAELARIAARIGSEHPEVRGWSVRVESLSEWLVDARARRASVLLLGAVGLLLLLACANVANLLLARATTRQADLGLRAALGAGRARLVRQMLAESLLLAAAGAVLGLLGAAWALEAVRALPPGMVARADEIGIDARVMAFALAVTLFTTLVFGLAPALHASRDGLYDALKHTARTGASRAQRRLRDGLVVAQVALAVVLLCGAGLLVRSLVRLQGVDVGFATEHAYAVPLQLSGERYADEARVARFYEAVVGRVAEIPGVAGAGATAVDPFSEWNLMNDVTAEERAAQAPPSGELSAAWRVVTPGYFGAAGVPLLQGRLLNEADRDGAPPVAVVSRTLAARLWPGESAVGKRLFWGGTDGTPRTVVGVVGDIRDVTLEADPPPLLFLSAAQVSWPSMTLVVRTRGEAPGLADAVRRAVWAVDPGLPVPEVRPMERSRAAAVAEPRLHALLLGTFAAAALLLAGVGLYAVLAFSVVQRAREIGVRMALGARSVAVMGMLVRRGLALTAAGIVIGLVGAALLSRFVQSLLYQTAGTDLATYAAVPLLLAVVGAAASWLPARRAARVDPMVVLRSE